MDIQLRDLEARLRDTHKLLATAPEGHYRQRLKDIEAKLSLDLLGRAVAETEERIGRQNQGLNDQPGKPRGREEA
jgi:hypothetical protein